MSPGRWACTVSKRPSREASAGGIPEGRTPMTAAIPSHNRRPRRTKQSAREDSGSWRSGSHWTPPTSDRSALPDNSTVSPRPRCGETHSYLLNAVRLDSSRLPDPAATGQRRMVRRLHQAKGTSAGRTIAAISLTRRHWPMRGRGADDQPPMPSCHTLLRALALSPWRSQGPGSARRISATRAGCSRAAKCPVSGSAIDWAPRSTARLASRSGGRDQSCSP
jgi:hypothetical protein